MIRFCDGEVDCVEYGSLTRLEILDYFLPDHKDNMLCVYDDFNTMGYIGIITYKSFQQSINVDGAIRKEYVIWDDYLWENARIYFRLRAEEPLLPVLSEEYQLIGFAYDDADADREIRMLRELQESSNALQFTDLYPGIKCVKIYEFNELAYFFALYLKSMEIAVITVGSLWQRWFCGGDYQGSDYECFSIYAEGIEEKKNKLLKSVSVEFECIDKIYESNILEGIIKDSEGDCSWFLEQIRDEKEIVIIGTGIESINAYDMLMANGIDILCFLSENQEEWEYRLFGKKILSEREIKYTAKKPVFLECQAENSAWGFGEVNRYDYEGYRRNQQYILLKDYADIHIGSLQNILKGKNVILLGNLNLCYNVERVFKDIKDCNITYWDILEENFEKEIQIVATNDKEIESDDICFLIEPPYICYDKDLQKQVMEKKKLYLQRLRERNVDNVTEYFSNREVFISIQKKEVEKYTLPSLTPGKILLNISGHMCGNDLFRFILDGHPNILTIDDNVIKNNLFFICVQLAEEKAENILDTFWSIYDIINHDAEIVRRKELFNRKFKELLNYKNTFTTQELFVLFHMAYAEMRGEGQISDIHSMLIYYEEREEASHENRMNYEEWLCDKRVEGFSINIIRNAYTRLGSFLKHLEGHEGLLHSNVGWMWKYMTYENEGQRLPNYWKRFGIKFEILKTRPKETLSRICDELGIPWDDCLLETTCRGKMAEYSSQNETIMGFDLKPVYNLYEEFFSDFDRFRVNMIFSGIQSKFGYSYVSCCNFSGRQLQEMFLKEFRFESRLSYINEYWKTQYRKDFISKVHTYLQKARREEIMQNGEDGFDSWENINMLLM